MLYILVEQLIEVINSAAQWVIVFSQKTGGSRVRHDMLRNDHFLWSIFRPVEIFRISVKNLGNIPPIWTHLHGCMCGITNHIIDIRWKLRSCQWQFPPVKRFSEQRSFVRSSAKVIGHRNGIHAISPLQVEPAHAFFCSVFSTRSKSTKIFLKPTKTFTYHMLLLYIREEFLINF